MPACFASQLYLSPHPAPLTVFAFRFFAFLWLALGASSATLRLDFQPQPLAREGATLTRLDWLVSELALQRTDG